MTGSGKLGAMTALTFLALSAQAAPGAQRFVLEGYESMGMPRLLTEARYEELIERSGPGRRRGAQASLAATNLCVAHIKTAQLDAARGSCDAAIVAARSHRRNGSPSWSASDRWLALARAYSNRAVLQWASGDRAAAAADLTKAAQYAPRAHFVTRNAAALAQRGEVGNALAAVAER